MRIDTDRLKAVYQDYIRQKTPSSLKDCPSPKKMVRLLRSRSSDKEATEIIDHISRCSFCFSEFEFLLEVLRQEKDFIQEVEKTLLNSDRPSHQKEPRHKILGWLLDWRTFVPRFSWRAALILGGVILAGFFMARSLIFRPSETFRGKSLAGVKLVAPVREKIPKAALVFRWKKVNNSKFYTLELFDQALAPVWNSDKITEESAVLPKELTMTLEVNRPYFWTVTAYLANGEKISSRLEKFIPKE
jgi:hypothetical protein